MTPAGLLVAALLAAQAPAWRTVTDEKNVAVAVQDVPGSSLERIRISGTSSASAELFATTWWGKASDTRSSAVKSREVLEDNGDVRLVYDVVDVPMGSERDYVLRMVKSKDASLGTVLLRYEGVDDARRPVRKDRLRMKVTTTLIVTPTQGGGCRFEHVVFSDIGGSVPAFILNEAQRRATLQLAKDIRREAEKASAPRAP